MTQLSKLDARTPAIAAVSAAAGGAAWGGVWRLAARDMTSKSLPLRAAGVAAAVATVAGIGFGALPHPGSRSWANRAEGATAVGLTASGAVLGARALLRDRASAGSSRLFLLEIGGIAGAAAALAIGVLPAGLTSSLLETALD